MGEGNGAGESKVLTITFKADGQLSVTGPLNERLLCYGMLEMAKEVIQDHKAKSEAGKIIPAMGLPFPRRPS